MSSQQQVPLLSVRNLSISFGPVKILHEVAFDLLPGEVHSLVGENGSGKSTIIKCLSGFYQPSSTSEMFVEGQPVALPYGAIDAAQHGLSFVHQDLALVPTLSVSDNLALSRGFKTRSGWRIIDEEERRRARAALSAFGVDIDPDEKIENLGQAQKTLVAIARGLDAESGTRRILVLDEPTAALPAKEVGVLFDAIRKLTAQGIGIIYVSHRLSEVLEISDRVTALRDGRVVGTSDANTLDERKLTSLIIGKSPERFFPIVPEPSSNEIVLKVEGLSGKRVQNVNLSVRRGEIVGIAGLLGSGRSELGRLLFGWQKKTSGKISINGKVANIINPSVGLDAGIAYVPEDRLNCGGVRDLTVGENFCLPRTGAFWRRGRLDPQLENAAVEAMIHKYDVRPPDPSARFGSLSGGNQQKVIVARALRLKPKIVILDEPAQGVDIGAKAEIFSIISSAARNGTSILLIDSDIEELCRLCERVLVLKNGRIVHEVSGNDRTRENINEAIHNAGDRVL